MNNIISKYIAKAKAAVLLPIAALMLPAASLLTSCGDNTGFWGEHFLTDEELAEMARQDSIAKANRERINADLILNYDVEFYISANSYDGAEVQIDLQQIADLFGIDKDKMCTDLDEGTGDVTPFAIEGSTHADNMGSGTAGTFWGHWWDADGNVCSWGDGAAVFSEFYGDEGIMNIGQYPGHLVGGQTVKIIEALKCGDKRVALVFNITAQERGEVKATVVGNSTVEIAMSPQTDYSSNPVAIPADDICSKLGISSMADAQFLCLNADGSYCQETDDGWGFWMDKNGYKGSWGDDASVMVGWDTGASEFGVLQMPDGLAEGESVTAHCAFLNGSKVYLVDVKVNIEAYKDPETAPTGDPQSITKDITLSVPYNTDYASDSYNLQEELRQAFKMTTYQIFSALKSGDLKVYVKEVTEADPVYTAGDGEYWLDADGNSTEWATGIAYMGLWSSETELVLEAGHHPDNVLPTTGASVKTTLIIACKGVTATYNITFNVTPQSSAKKHRR